MRGEGSIYQRGPSWWVRYYAHGRRVREAAKVPDKAGVLRPARNEEEARRALRRRVKEVLGGHFLGLQAERVTVAGLLDAVAARAEAKGLRSRAKMKSHAKPLRAFFALRPAVDVTAAEVERYKAKRKAAGKAAATVCRELELLRHAYRVAVQDKTLPPGSGPHIELLPVDNARGGFFEGAEVAALLPHLEPALRDFVEWAFTTGMRKGEAAALTWPMLDRSGPVWTFRIPAAIVKNKAGRALPVVGTAKTIIERRVRARRLGCEFVFHRESKGKAGQPIKGFDKAWSAALKATGLPAERGASSPAVGCERDGVHEDHRPPDAEHVPAVLDRQRRRGRGRTPEARRLPRAEGIG